MKSMNRAGRVRDLVSVALCALVSGCASYIEGSEEPPFDWAADAASTQCTALTGTYFSAGLPAAANADAGTYGQVWPTEGSLLSIVERGTNANPRKRPRPDPAVDPVDVVPSISIIVDGSGSVRFEAKSAQGKMEQLRPQVWTCESGSLNSLVALSTENFESHVRLWRRGNALVAEQTIRETNGHGTGGRAHRPVARFHFLFASTLD
jgi:hypothetical protein